MTFNANTPYKLVNCRTAKLNVQESEVWAKSQTKIEKLEVSFK